LRPRFFFAKIVCIALFLALSSTAYADGGAAVFTKQLIQNGDLSIHFLELGNRYTGDCVYINYGAIDIIIDAGSRQSSALVIREYIGRFMTDNKIEYVIATHAHQDHIAAFYSSESVTGIFDAIEIGLIIDFPLTNSQTATYKKYTDSRDRAVSNGAIHFNALQCFNNTDGAERIFNLGQNLELEILYNYYYENRTYNENNYSVCVRINHDENHYLFTGDLEQDAEEKLVDYYDENFNGLGRCVLYKGGHHGSNTAGSEKLFAAITPEYVCICTCAGSSEYRAAPLNTFPAQGFIDRLAPYTDKVYITTLGAGSNGEFTSLNGDIIFLVSNKTVTVLCSNDNRALKETEWFKNNRQMPAAWIEDHSPQAARQRN
jgi:beta-lactamase superfamily II metal-dependent hydrolase